MTDSKHINKLIRENAATELLLVTEHAQREMAAEAISLDDVVAALIYGYVLEDYPEHRRGACCLVYGKDSKSRDIHIVCTTAQTPLIIITAYLPLPPKWVSATQRREKP